MPTTTILNSTPRTEKGMDAQTAENAATVAVAAIDLLLWSKDGPVPVRVLQLLWQSMTAKKRTIIKTRMRAVIASALKQSILFV